MLENYREFFSPQLGTPQECYGKYSYKTYIHYIIFIIGFTYLFLTAVFQQGFLFFVDKVATSGLIIQHQLPAGNCSFR